MPRGKVNHFKERHTIWVSPIAWKRIDNMALKAANGNKNKKNASEIWEAAGMAYKVDGEEMFFEMKRMAAIKVTVAQNEFRQIEAAEAAYLEKKKNELEEEVKNALTAKRKVEFEAIE